MRPSRLPEILGIKSLSLAVEIFDPGRLARTLGSENKHYPAGPCVAPLMKYVSEQRRCNGWLTECQTVSPGCGLEYLVSNHVLEAPFIEQTLHSWQRRAKGGRGCSPELDHSGLPYTQCAVLSDPTHNPHVSVVVDASWMLSFSSTISQQL